MLRIQYLLSSSKHRVGNFKNEDDDVSEERQRVEANEVISENVIIMRNLTKDSAGAI